MLTLFVSASKTSSEGNCLSSRYLQIILRRKLVDNWFPHLANRSAQNEIPSIETQLHLHQLASRRYTSSCTPPPHPINPSDRHDLPPLTSGPSSKGCISDGEQTPVRFVYFSPMIFLPVREKFWGLELVFSRLSPPTAAATPLTNAALAVLPPRRRVPECRLPARREDASAPYPTRWRLAPPRRRALIPTRFRCAPWRTIS
jgi:hypothetical protein